MKFLVILWKACTLCETLNSRLTITHTHCVQYMHTHAKLLQSKNVFAYQICGKVLVLVQAEDCLYSLSKHTLSFINHGAQWLSGGHEWLGSACVFSFFCDWPEGILTDTSLEAADDSTGPACNTS